MRLELFVFAEYAAMTGDLKLMIAGTFNSIKLQPVSPDTTADAPVIRLPHCFLVAVVTASLSEGLTHQAELRVVNEDSDPVFDPIAVGEWNFLLNPNGRPMRFQAVMGLTGLELPGPGDYSVQLWVSGTNVGDTPLYVDPAPTG